MIKAPWLKKRRSPFLRGFADLFRVKHHEVCNLLPNSSGEIFPCEGKIKCVVTVMTGQSRQRVHRGSFYHLRKFEVFQKKKLRGK